MAASYNRATIIGRVGSDPITKNFDGGGKVVNFSIATNQGKDKNGQELTEWHRICAFASEKQKIGNIVEQYVRKGSLVLVSGQLRTRTWEKDGIKHSSTEIMANEVQLLSPKSDNGLSPTSSSYGDNIKKSATTTIGPGQSTMSGSEQAPIYNDLDSDIPF